MHFIIKTNPESQSLGPKAESIISYTSICKQLGSLPHLPHLQNGGNLWLQSEVVFYLRGYGRNLMGKYTENTYNRTWHITSFLCWSWLVLSASTCYGARVWSIHHVVETVVVENQVTANATVKCRVCICDREEQFLIFLCIIHFPML